MTQAMNTLTGVVHSILEEQRIDDEMIMRKIVVETTDESPQLVEFDAVNDTVPLLNELSPGDKVQVDFDILFVTGLRINSIEKV